MTMAEHRELGLALARMRDELVKITVWLPNKHLPKSSPAVTALSQALDKIDKAMDKLDSQVFADYPPGDGGAGQELMTVYYPHMEDRERYPSGNITA